MKKLNKDNGGFSLVEIIIAVVILGIITVPLLHTLLVGARTAGKSADVQQANNAAQSLMELVKAKGADTVYKTPATLINGAEKAENSPNKTEIIKISNYSVASREYDAVVTISADDTVSAGDETIDKNAAALVKSNRMDVTINMKDADSRAQSDFRWACRRQVPDEVVDGVVTSWHWELAVKQEALLKRDNDITITAARTAGENGVSSYEIKVKFTYSAPVTDFDTQKYYTYSVETVTRLDKVAATPYGQAAFSVFLLYDAYWRTDTQNIIIENPDSEEADFNVFLVNTQEDNKKPAGYSGYNISYKYQRFDGNDTCVRVFTNLPSKPLSYNAYKTDSNYANLRDKVTGQLVETAVEQRRYKVNVKLFEPGGTEELISLDAEMQA